MQYSRFRPAKVSEKENTVSVGPRSLLPVLLVGFAFTAALLVLLLLTQSRLSELSFEISALEQERSALKVQHEKLRVTHAQVYSLERIEQVASELGMVPPMPHQYIEIPLY